MDIASPPAPYELSRVLDIERQLPRMLTMTHVMSLSLAGGLAVLQQRKPRQPMEQPSSSLSQHLFLGAS